MALMNLDFEKPIVEIEQEISNLESSSLPSDEKEAELNKLKEKLEQTKIEIYSNLSPWQRVLLARHQARPHSLDYINAIITNFTEFHGDRNFSDDKSVVCGMGFFEEQPVTVIGQQKGKDTKENIMRNFGMMHPEGYRKALRVMDIGSRFKRPIIIFIDTPGAFPGIGAEERGQAEAIARNIRDMFFLKVPIIVIVIGEGASGGALGVGLGDVVLMLENAWYCVISPEGCASILWRDKANAPRAAEALKLTAPDLIKLGVIDEIIPEPLGGAHRDPKIAYDNVKKSISNNLNLLKKMDIEQLIQKRYDKYRNMGFFIE